MAQYKVLHGIILGARPGETVELSDDDAKAYGPEYVQKIGKSKDPEAGSDPTQAPAKGADADAAKPNKDKAMKGADAGAK